MKAIFIMSFLLLAFTSFLHAQHKTDTTQNAYTKEYFLELSKKQKSQATLLVITGGVTALVGGFIWFVSPIAGISGSSNGVENARRTGITITAAGASLAAFSIPLFNASKRNLKNAELYVGSNSFLYPTGSKKDYLCIGAKIEL